MSARNKVLRCFKSLNRTSQQVFKGDKVMLKAARDKIREEFSKNKTETDPERILELLKTGEEAEEVLRRLVVQGVQKSDGTYQLLFTQDTFLEDNAPLPKR